MIPYNYTKYNNCKEKNITIVKDGMGKIDQNIVKLFVVGELYWRVLYNQRFYHTLFNK